MELNIKESLESVKIYGRYLSEFLLPDQIDLLAKSLQKDIEQKLTLTDVSFELPSDEIFDMPEVNLNNPLEEFYYYERPPYLNSDQKDFKERLQKALNYLKGN